MGAPEKLSRGKHLLKRSEIIYNLTNDGLLRRPVELRHYACADYRALLERNRITPSMSRKGNCWDNAVAESFFSSFAFELEFESNWYDVHDVERAAGEYIEGFYNPQRLHSHNGYLSPIDFEHQFVQQVSAT